MRLVEDNNANVFRANGIKEEVRYFRKLYLLCLIITGGVAIYFRVVLEADWFYFWYLALGPLCPFALFELFPYLQLMLPQGMIISEKGIRGRGTWPIIPWKRINEISVEECHELPGYYQLKISPCVIRPCSLRLSNEEDPRNVVISKIQMIRGQNKSW